MITEPFSSTVRAGSKGPEKRERERALFSPLAERLTELARTAVAVESRGKKHVICMRGQADDTGHTSWTLMRGGDVASADNDAVIE